MRRVGQIRSWLQVALVASALAFGAWTALPTAAETGLRCSLPGPCTDNCFETCQRAMYEDGGECNTFQDCCLCYE